MEATRVVWAGLMVLLSIGVGVIAQDPEIQFSDGAEDACELDSGEKGTCRLISGCPAVLAEIATKHPKHCGFEGFTPIVCCPIAEASVTEPAPVAAEPAPVVAEPAPAPEVAEPAPAPVAAEPAPNLDIRVSSHGVSSPPVDFECGNPSSVSFSVNVIGGEDARRGLATYMALLGERSEGNDDDWFCDGVLLNDRWVLSAAHCFDRRVPNVVRLGDYDYNDPQDGSLHVDSTVVQIVRHPNYTFPQVYHDLTLLEIKNISFNIQIKPVCLPWGKEADKNLTSSFITVTGWGVLDYDGPSSHILQEVNVTVFPSSRCNDAYSTLDSFSRTWPQGIAEETLCAGDPEGGKDACQGDSGGPAVYSDTNGLFTLAGIVSTGYGCGLDTHPGLYVDVRRPEYLEWIKNVAFGSTA